MILFYIPWENSWQRYSMLFHKITSKKVYFFETTLPSYSNSSGKAHFGDYWAKHACVNAFSPSWTPSKIMSQVNEVWLICLWRDINIVIVLALLPFIIILARDAKRGFFQICQIIHKNRTFWRSVTEKKIDSNYNSIILHCH